MRDNCKNCIAQCEHAGKDREFVCRNGKSCKEVASEKSFSKLLSELNRYASAADMHNVDSFGFVCFQNLNTQIEAAYKDGQLRHQEYRALMSLYYCVEDTIRYALEKRA